MKTATKIFAIIASAMVALGIVLAIIGGIFGGRSAGSSVIWEDKSETFPVSQFSTIQTDLSNRKVVLKPTSTNEIRVEYATSEKYKVSCNASGSTLSIDSANTFHWFSFDFTWLFGQTKNTQVTIYLPSTYDGNLNLDTSNGAIDVDGFDKLRDVDLKSSNGKIEFENASCERLNVKTSNSAITLSDITCNNKIYAKSSNGTVTFEQVTAIGDVEAETSNGKISFTSCTSKKMLYGKTSNGTISISDIDAADIRLKTSNGGIRGDIQGKMGDFSITSDTSNGKCNLPDGSSGSTDKTLDVKSSNGSIDIEFDD